MPQGSVSEPEPDDSDAETEFVEVDPFGRYGRYKEVLGKGAFKKVYRAFDEWEGIEVAWNQVKVADLLRNSVDVERLYSEVHLLKTLKHKNIIKFYNSWVDSKNEQINFITEIFTSGTLRQYRKKHKHVDVRALKKWSRQILEGLFYLHSNDPPVIHRDLKCDNIFVNGNQGEVKIGDLGLAAILQQARAAHSVIGTPEFMAPELYEEEYNELVDIYAFGMCLLELVTLEYPYVECSNAAQIYKKVTAGIKPASLGKVRDPEVRAFIEKCIAKVSNRLSAKELLMDPFLLSDEDSRNRGCSLEPQPSSAEENDQQVDSEKNPQDSILEGSRDFTVQGQRKDHNTIFLKLRIEDLSGDVKGFSFVVNFSLFELFLDIKYLDVFISGHVRNIHFPFDIEVDTSIAVASEMVQELDLTDHDVSVLALMIDSEIQSHIPDWVPKEVLSDNSVESETVQESGWITGENVSAMVNDLTQSCPLVLERLPSGRKYWSDSPRVSVGNSPLRPGPSHVLHTDSVASGDSWFEENSQSPVSHRDLGISYCASPLRHVDDSDHEDYMKQEHAPIPLDSRFNKGVMYLEVPCQEADQLAENTRPSTTNSVDFKSIVVKLEHLLDEQLKEFDELKQNHKLAVLDLLKELPYETREMALSICSKKFGRSKLHDDNGYSTNYSTDLVALMDRGKQI